MVPIALHVRDAERRRDGEILEQRDGAEIGEIFAAEVKRAPRLDPAPMCDEAALAIPRITPLQFLWLVPA